MKLINLNKAQQIILDGGVLIMPTDTTYGITCDVNNPAAVQKVFEIKGRDPKKSFTIHIGELNMIDEWIEVIPEKARKLMNKFWPGDLNIIFETYRFVNYITKRENSISTVAIRMPDHQIPITLSKRLGNAIIGTSANFSGEVAVDRFDNLDPEFIKLTDGVIEGKCGGKEASAVVGFDKKGELEVFREGRLKKEDFEKVL